MDNTLSKTIGQRINSMLAERNKKQKELAAALNVTDNTVSYYCSGTRLPNTSQIKIIADFLDCSADYLLGLTDTVTTDKDIRFICDYTGLNEKSVKTLNALNEPLNIFNAVPRDIIPVINFLINDMNLRLTDNGCSYRRGTILPGMLDYFRCACDRSEQQVFVTQNGKIFSSENEAKEETDRLEADIKGYFNANAADLSNAAFYDLLTAAIKSAKERYIGDLYGNNQETQ